MARARVREREAHEFSPSLRIDDAPHRCIAPVTTSATASGRHSRRAANQTRPRPGGDLREDPARPGSRVAGSPRRPTRPPSAWMFADVEQRHRVRKRPCRPAEAAAVALMAITGSVHQRRPPRSGEDQCSATAPPKPASRAAAARRPVPARAGRHIANRMSAAQSYPVVGGSVGGTPNHGRVHGNRSRDGVSETAGDTQAEPHPNARLHTPRRRRGDALPRAGHRIVGHRLWSGCPTSS